MLLRRPAADGAGPRGIQHLGRLPGQRRQARRLTMFPSGSWTWATRCLADSPRVVIDAMAGRQDPVIVGQSYGAFTATLVAVRLPVRLLVLLAGMIDCRADPGLAARDGAHDGLGRRCGG